MRKLYRSQSNKVIGGLCGGLGESFGVDVTLLRVVTAFTAFFSFGTAVPLYIIACLVIPKEPIFNRYNGGPGMTPPPFQSYSGYGQTTYPGYGGQTTYPGQGTGFKTTTAQPSADPIDEMMKDVEKKALRKEIDDLKAKLAKYEKGDV